MPSGSGFLGGYGEIARSGYATPLELAYKPWTADFITENGNPAYPTDAFLNPYFNPAQPVAWRTEDWDPGLRFWALPGFDAQLTEWLQDIDLASPSVMAAREFAQQHTLWTHADPDIQVQRNALVADRWLEADDVRWMPTLTAAGRTAWRAALTSAATATAAAATAPGHTPTDVAANVAAQAAVTAANAITTDAASRNDAWLKIQIELTALVDQMQDSRERYLGETLAQAEGIPNYFTHLLALDQASKPWTMELMRCGLALGNVGYMYFKARFKRVRPSRLCPGLVPPMGPPSHPAFPSGHSFLGHFIALLLLQVEGIARLHGPGLGVPSGAPGNKPAAHALAGTAPVGGSLLWLADRLATNRERLGVHYPSDSSASRHLAQGIWMAIFHTKTIDLPTLQRVLIHARAEWE